MSSEHGGHAFPFVEQLKRRNVGRVALLYLGLAYLLLEIFEVFFHLLELPAWTGRLAVFMAVLGFPAALMFAWVYEVTPEGLKFTHEVEPEKSITRHTGKRLDRAIIAVLAVALTYFVVDKFWLSHREAAGVQAGEQTAGAGAGEKSIAVLAFSDMSEKKDQEYFSDGLADELLDQLAHVPGLTVIARTSSFYFKGKQVPFDDIGRQLHVANILEGSVRRSGDHLRVTTQLVRADTGAHLWSETYDRQMKDIFQVQDEITAAVVGALKVKLAAGQNTATTGTRNPEAYTQYLLARQIYMRAFDAGSYGKAVEAFEKAIALDPKYADAYAALAVSKSARAEYLGDSGKGIDEALADADKAVTLGPDRPVPYRHRASIRESSRWDWEGAMADAQKALALDSGDAGAWGTLSVMLADQGRFTEALADNKRARELDPLHPAAWQNYAALLDATGQYPAAHQAYAHLLQIQPTSSDSSSGMEFVMIQLHEGKLGDALATARKIRNEDIRLPAIAMAECSLHHEGESQHALQEAQSKFAKEDAYLIAFAYGWCGDANRAFEWLDRAYSQRDGGLVEIRQSPAFARLRGDPRYAALLRKMKFPEEPATH